MRVLDRRLVRTIAGAKAQYGAVALVICIGLITYTSLANTSLNLAVAVEEYYREYGFADLFAEFVPVPVALVQSMADMPGVEAVEPRVVVEVRVDLGREPYPTLRLVSLLPDQRLNRLYLEGGRLPVDAGERGIALLSGFARANGLSVGDSVRLVIRGETFPLEVTALVESPEFMYAIRDIRNLMPDEASFGAGFVNLPLLQELAGMSGQANGAVIALRPRASPEEVRDLLEEAYRGQGLKAVVTREDQLSHALVSMELEQLQNMSRAVPVLLLGVAAAVVYVLLARMVQADRTSIGVLKALGYGSGEVVAHYLKLSLAVGLSGGAGGVGAGYLLAGALSQLYLEFFHLPLFQARLYLRFAALGLLLAALFCGGAGLGAARAVLGIAPAEAMRPPAPFPGSRSILERLVPAWWERFTFPWKMVLRDVFRRKQRFALAVAGVALTYAVTVMSLFFWTAWDTVLVKQFEDIENYDYAVTFQNPVGSSVTAEMRALALIGAAEPFTEYPFTVCRGWRREDVVGRALPAGTAFYRFEDADGNPVALPRTGVLLSRQIADRLGVGPGDEVVVTSYATRGEERPVPVRAVITQYVGSGMYMSLEQMERLTGQVGVVSGVLLASRDDIKGAFGSMGNVSSVFSTSDLASAYYEYLDLALASISLMVVLGGMLGFAILYNTGSVGVSERMREFSSLRVMGLSRSEVFGLILRENVLALALGLVAGVPLAQVFVRATLSVQEATELLWMPTDIQVRTYLLGGLLVLVFVALTLGALWMRVRKVNFLEAMSSRLT